MSSKVQNSVEFTDIGAAAARHEASNDDNNNTKSPQNGPSAAASSEYRVNGSDSETAHASAGSRVSSRIVEVHIDDAPSLEPHSIWSYNQALRYFLDEQDDAVDSTTTDERAAIAKPAKKRGCFCCFEKGYRFAEAENEERAVLSIVARGFEVNRSVPEQHRRIVETIYFHLTGEHWVSEKQALQEEKMQAPDDLSDIRRSSWEDIGFQGENPGTDLRSAGMFSMLQMLWICEKQPGFLEGLFELSRHPQLGFPLMLVGINTTLVCVQALKAKKLFDVCNATESVIDGVNELYFGLLQHLQRIWEERQLTVMDFQATLEELRTIANSRPKSVVGH